jgi:hypothetical protein
MNRRSNSVFVLCLGAALGLAALPAVAGDHEKQWNRGCADAKAGTYDRAKHGEHYEKGWQSCNQQKQSSSSSAQQPTRNMKEADDYSRGCDDAKAGSYDRANPTPAYERGWQSCNQKDDDSANEGANRQKEWDRGCADSKAKTYDRARHNADYEAGWNACKSD